MNFVDSKNSMGKFFRGVYLLLTAGIFTLSAYAQTQGTGVITVAANGNSCIAYTEAQSGGPDNWEVAEGGSYTMTITGVTECAGEVMTVFVQSSNTGNFCFNVINTGNAGEYVGNFTMPEHACFTMPLSYKCGADQPCDNSDAFDAMGPSGSTSVHLRAAIFDGSCGLTGTDETCEEIHDPIISCPSNNFSQCDNGSNIVTFNVTAVNDGCTGQPTVSQIAGLASGSSFPLGTTTNTFLATDDCGGSATCSFTVTIKPTPDVSIHAEGPTSVCSPGCVTLTASGATTYLWSNGATGSSISACSTGDYSVTGTTDGCSDSPAAPVHVTINPPPTVTVSATGPTTVCSPNCVTLNASGATTYLWSNGATGSSISACSSGSYTVTGTDANGCTDASDPISVTIRPKPTCSLSAPNPLPICGLTGNNLTVSITGAYTTIVWGLSPSSWVINSGQGTPTISYKAGNSGTSGTFTVTVTNSYGCSSSCTVTFGTRCEEHCGYTQGFYSGTGKICDQSKTAIQAINAALLSGSLVNGITGTSAVTILSSEGGCLQGKLPSGTTPTALPAATNINCSGLTGTWLNSGKIKNNLLGQTITLGLNMRLDATLGSMAITGPYITTYKASTCVNGVATAGTKTVKQIPTSVLSCLTASGNSTVAGLRDLANKALAGTLGTCAASVPDINTAVDAINNAFDGCRILAGFGTSSAGLRETEEEAFTMNPVSENDLELSVHPNPVSSNSVVLFRSQEDANLHVDLYDFSGQKVSALFSGSVEAGQPNGVEIDASSLAAGIYLLVLQTDTKSTFQKIVVMK